MPRRACTTDTHVDDEGQIASGDRVATTANDEDYQPSTVGVRGRGVTTTGADNTDDEQASLPAHGRGSRGRSRSRRTARSSSPSTRGRGRG